VIFEVEYPGTVPAFLVKRWTAARVTLPPSGDRWLQPGNPNRPLSNRRHPLPSGGSGASNASTVWRQVATAEESNRPLPNRSHPLPSGGQRREERFHRLATGGYGDRWLRRQVVLGSRSRSFSGYSKPCNVLKANETLSASGSAFNPKSLSPTSAIPAI